MKSESSGEKLLLKLKRDWQLLKKSLESLSASAKKCEAIGIKTNYTFEIYAGALRFVPTLIKEINSTERFFAKREWI